MSDLAVIAEPDAPEVPAAGQAPSPGVAAPEVTGVAGAPAVALADLLVEEVSIDGMCGVY